MSGTFQNTCRIVTFIVNFFLLCSVSGKNARFKKISIQVKTLIFACKIFERLSVDERKEIMNFVSW